MKFKAYLAFTALMLAAAISGNIHALTAWAAIFTVGALLSPRQSLAFSAVAGYLNRANADTNDDVGEYQAGVLHRNAKGMNNGSTLFGLMSRLKSEEAESQTYNWFEKDPTRRSFYAAAAYTTETEIKFTNQTGASSYDTGTLDTTICSLLKAGSILENTLTGERITVTVSSSDYSTPITVARGGLGYTSTPTSAVQTAVQNIAQYQEFVLITLAKPNGANPVESAFTKPSLYRNYCQTFNETASVENAYKNGILRSDVDGPWEQQKSEALERIAGDIELAYFFGIAGIVGTTYTTGGIRNAVDAAGYSANALAGLSGTGVTLAVFDEWMASFMTWGSDVKLAFCGPKAYAAISRYANSAAGGYRIMQDEAENVFGLNLTVIQTPYGRIDLASHPLFKTIPAHQGTMMVVDLEHLVQKNFEPLFFEKYAPTNGADSLQGQFRAKLGLKLQNPQAFGYATNLWKINAS